MERRLEPEKEKRMSLDSDEDTTAKLLRRNRDRWGDNSIAINDKNFGIWQQYTWKHEYDQVKYLGLGLVSLGLKPNDKVAVMGDNDPELYWSNLSIQAVHGISVPLFPGAAPSEIAFVLDHSESKFVVARDQEQVDKLLGLWDKLPNVEKVIWWYGKGVSDYKQPFLQSWDKTIEMGRKYEQDHPAVFEELVSQTKADHIANIFYSAGTTGRPKAALWSHKALIGATCAMLASLPLSEKDKMLCFLPLAFIGESLFTLIPHLVIGARLHCPERPDTVLRDTREVAPGLLLGEPKMWEELARKVKANIDVSGTVERFVYRILMPMGIKVQQLELAGKNPGLFLRFGHWIADLILFRPIRGHLGLSNTVLPLTTGSVISADTLQFFHGLGINLRQVFLSSEAGVISGHVGKDVKPGTVGLPIEQVDLKIANDGEILVRSPYIFSGYHKQENLYKDAVDEQGWLHSGDAGYIDKGTGHLVYLDRMAALATFPNGNQYGPQYIESQLRFNPYIKDAMAIRGDGRDYVTAMVVIEVCYLGMWAEKNGVVYTTLIDLSQKPEVAELVRDEIERVNACLPKEAQVRKFVCLTIEFDADSGHLTRLRKLKRHAIEKRYNGLLDAVYAGSKEFAVEDVVASEGTTRAMETTLKIQEVKPG